MNDFSKLRLTNALELTPEAMDAILLSCGIPETHKILNDAEVQTIQAYLQQQCETLAAQSQARLEETIAQYTIMVDTCSLLHARAGS